MTNKFESQMGSFLRQDDKFVEMDCGDCVLNFLTFRFTFANHAVKIMVDIETLNFDRSRFFTSNEYLMSMLAQVCVRDGNGILFLIQFVLILQKTSKQKI